MSRRIAGKRLVGEPAPGGVTGNMPRSVKHKGPENRSIVEGMKDGAGIDGPVNTGI